MKVSEVMTRDVQTVRPDQTAREAASFMLRADAGSIPVTEGDRLDNITARFLGDPTQFWRVCDANLALLPDELEKSMRQVSPRRR